MKKAIILLVLSISFLSSSCTKEYYITESVDDAETINVVKESQNDDSIPNVIPNDGLDDSDAIQLFIDNNPGKILFFEAGTYDLETPLCYSPNAAFGGTVNYNNQPGLKIVGEGINNTIFNNKTGDYGIKILGTRNVNGKLELNSFQTNGFFKNFSIPS